MGPVEVRSGPEAALRIADFGLRIADLGSVCREATEDVKHEDMKHDEALRAVGSFCKSVRGTEVML